MVLRLLLLCKILQACFWGLSKQLFVLRSLQYRETNFVIAGLVRSSPRLSRHHRLCVWNIFQLPKHHCSRPQGDAGQPNQPDPVLHRCGGHPPDAGVHPLHCTHVHPDAECGQGARGQGEGLTVKVWHCHTVYTLQFLPISVAKLKSSKSWQS